MDRAVRWLWSGWALSALLGFLAPWRRVLIGLPGSGALPIHAGVGVMVAVMFLVRKRPQLFFSALLMSISGLAIGAAVGFVALWLAFHRPLNGILGLKWIFFGGILTAAFVQQMRTAIAPVSEYQVPSLEGLSPAEAHAVLQAEFNAIHERSNLDLTRAKRIVLFTIPLFVALGVLMFMGKRTLSPTQESMAYAFIGTAILLSCAGIWKTARS